ncbi:MAG: MBL fold metallo-hydrolase [Syntrophomonadaceae bacterium]|jgi:glyoxylase-like metal-dependent hydrolase (beta-lactamase superfamily II)
MQQLTEHVKLFGNGYFNYYVVGEEEAALIECGTSAGAVIFAQQWKQLPVKPDIKYIVVLHSHFDHVCGIPILRQLFPSALVVGSSSTQKVLSKEKAMAGAFASDRYVSESYLQQGFIEAIPQVSAPGPIAVDVVVGEGDHLLLGDTLKLDILDAPGHSPCSLAAYLESDQIMFVSDAAGYKTGPEEISPVFFQNYDSYMSTLQRFQTFPLQVLAMAHGDVMQGSAVGEYLQQSIRAAEEGFAFIKAGLQSGVDEKQIGQQVFERYLKGGMAYYPPDIMLSTMQLLVKNVKDKL